MKYKCIVCDKKIETEWDDIFPVKPMQSCLGGGCWIDIQAPYGSRFYTDQWYGVICDGCVESKSLNIVKY